jgi:prophage DNA circulation protein
MSGFTTGITGFAPPTSIAGFMGLLQAASFRGVPFKVVAAQVKKGRRQAIHEYPFVDGGWPEDMGRALRMYSFSGYLIGDVAPVMQLLLDNAIETKGPGLLIHPTLGALQVAVASASTAVHKDKMRVIEVAFEFIEAGANLFPLTVIATAIEVLAAADSALTAVGTDLGGAAIPAAAAGPAVTGEAQAVVASFGAAAVVGGANPTALVGMAAALPPPDANTTYGRYGAGSASVNLPIGTTVASLQAQLANQRAALALAIAGAAAAAASYSASTDMADALAALVEAMRATMTDPADQVQVLLGLAGFTFVDGAGGSVGIGAAMATMRDAMAAACRRAALVSLARASASYQPSSYNDAAALRVALSEALGVEITAAGDCGQDASYLALKSLRASVVQDLTVRGASLPSIVTVTFAMSLPSLVIAHTLYLDASRSDQITAESGAIHPAFCPATFKALASGTAPTVNPSYDFSNNAGVPLIAPGGSTGVYRLPVPGQVVGLTVLSTTSSSASLGWSGPASGGSPSSYVVQQSAHGAGVFATVGQTGAVTTAFTVTGLASDTAYDFQVYAVNATGDGSPSAIVTATTQLNPPNAVSGLSATAGSPAYSVMALSWTASATDGTHDAAATYTPQYQLASGGSWTTFGSPIAGTSVNITGLAHDTAYNFQVIASNTGGTATSSTVTATTAVAAPNVPNDVAAVAGSPAYSVVAQSWTASATDGTHDAAATYQPQYALVSGGGWSSFGSPIAGTSVNITGLAHDTAYNFQVIATNTGGTATSSTATATTAVAAPNAVSGLTPSAGVPAYSVTGLTWTASATDGTHDAAATYTAQYVLASGGSWTTFVTKTGLMASVTGLAHATAYNFQVIATNPGGTATSSTVTRTTDFAPPNVPVISSVAPVTDGTTSKLAVTWAASVVDGTHDAATSYNLRTSVHGAGSWTTVTGVTSPYTVTGLTAGTSYDVEVQAANASTTSPSAWSSATTASTYSIAMVWSAGHPPPSPWTHSTTNVVQVAATPNPTAPAEIDFYFSNSATTNSNIAAWTSTTAGGYPISPNLWGAFMTAPATTGTYYVWAVVSAGGTGTFVSTAITVT